MEIDALNRHILSVLLDDSRLSYRQIAKKVGVSAATVMNRVKELEKTIIKKYTTILDFEKLGYEFLGEYKDNSYIIKTPKGEEENLMKELTEKYSQFFEKSSLRYSKLDKRFEFIANLENLVQNLDESVEKTNFSDKLKEISNYIRYYED